MAITNFQRTVWSKKIQTALETITGLKNHSDYEFEGEIQYAKEVKILGVVRPTIKTYVPGTPIELETPTDSSQMLKIDQLKYFNFAVEDVDKAQSQPGLMDKLTSEAGKGLAEEADKYIAKIVKDGVEDGTIESTEANITKANAISTLEDALAVLYTNNVKTTEELHFEVTPKVFTLLRQSLTELFTENVEMSKKGYVGRYGNALISVENNLPEISKTTGSGDSAVTTTKKVLILRTKKAVAYVGQIDKTEAYRPQNAFQDAIKALFVFGAKVVRPKEIYCIKCA